MRKLILFCAFAVIATSLFAQTPAAPYTQTAKWTIGGEGGWDYLALDPDASRLFVAHSMVITVIDLATGKQVGEIPANGAHGVAFDPAKHLGFSTNGKAGTVTVWDSQTLKVQTDIKVGDGPDAIIFDPNSKRVIVMHGRSKDIMVIDPSTLKVEATVPLGGKLEFAAADPGHVYVNVEDKGEIAVVDSKTWKQTATWKLPDCEEPSGLAIDNKANKLFTVCGNKKMIVLDTKTGKDVATLPTGDGTDAAAFDSEKKFAFASNGEGTLTVVREAKGGKYEVAGSVTTQRGARTMALNPKTHQVYLATAEFGPPAEGQKRPSIKSGSFMILVYSPAK